MHAAILASKYALHIVGRVRRLADTLAPESSLAAYQFSCFGESLRNCSPPCPLTVLESWLERNAGVEPEQGGFLLDYLDKLVYPNIPQPAYRCGGNCVCAESCVLWLANLEGSIPLASSYRKALVPESIAASLNCRHRRHCGSWNKGFEQ